MQTKFVLYELVVDRLIDILFLIFENIINENKLVIINSYATLCPSLLLFSQETGFSYSF